MIGLKSETLAGVTLMATLALLTLAVLGTLTSKPRLRRWWAGFAVFGWGYFLMAHWYAWNEGPLPTVPWPDAGPYIDLFTEWWTIRIAHDLWALAFAILGGWLAVRLFPDRAVVPEEPASDSDEPGWWRRPLFVGVIGSVLMVATALVGLRWDPEIGSSAVFLWAWAMAVLTVVGAFGSRGQTRAAWLGAACFGVSYLVAAFTVIGTAQLPTNHLLLAIFHPDGPTTTRDAFESGDRSEESRRLREALEQTIITLDVGPPVHLKDVFTAIKAAVPLGEPPRIYSASVPYTKSIRDVETLEVSMVHGSLSAAEALNRGLQPLGLSYRLRRGDIIIIEAFSPIPYEHDPVLIAGHSLIAMLAMWFGGLAAPLIAGRVRCQRETSDPLTPAPEASP